MALAVAPPIPSLLFSSSTKPSFAAITTLVPLPNSHFPIKVESPRLAFLSTTPLFRPSHCSALQEATAVAEDENEANQGTKLYIANLPWTFSAPEIDALFRECGTVTDVEIVKQRNGKSRGFAFVTMGSPQEAQAAIDKFDSYKLLERIIRVEYAKNLKKPASAVAAAAAAATEDTILETKHLIYSSNLAWKLRSNDLREFFSASFKPVSAKVVFDSPSGKAAGYGFVSFATKEEAEAAVAELDGKELMGRPLRLKISEKKGEPAHKPEVTNNIEVQAEEA